MRNLFIRIIRVTIAKIAIESFFTISHNDIISFLYSFIYIYIYIYILSYAVKYFI